jgi:NAD(P)-dependent dehydrogenase (short-subunit alcohol dehydrogenase family)
MCCRPCGEVRVSETGAIADPTEGILAGHYALVTGAASGIGKAVAARFAACGASVVGVDVNADSECAYIDVTDEAAVGSAFDAAERRGNLTDVVHCAGIVRFSPIRDLALEEWRRILDVNLTGSFLIGREAARRLRSGGSLTFVSSIGGLRSDAQKAAYTASKFGVTALTQSLGRELIVDGIRVNSVCPGGVRTPMSDATIEFEAARDRVTPDEKRRQHNRRVPRGRLAEPEEIADVCVFLSSPLAAHVASASILVAGGEVV